MKLKYRRIILFIILFTMGMGMLTFSIGVEDTKESNVLSEEQIESAKSAALKKNENKKVCDLIKNFTDAKLNGDVDKLALYVNDVSHISKDELDVPTTYMEGYETIDCYIIDIPIEDNYVVYVYKEYKMKGIETVIPSVVRHYVRPDDKDNLVIYSGDVEASIVEYINNTRHNSEVEQLINMVNNKIEQIKKEDVVAKAFLDKLDEVVEGKDTPKESADPKKSDKPTESKNPEESNKPAESENPEKSNKPVESVNPDNSAKPQSSDAPKATKTVAPSATS